MVIFVTSRNLLQNYVLDFIYFPFIKIYIYWSSPYCLEQFLRAIWNIISWAIILSSVQSLSCVRLFGTPWTATLQVSLSITNSWSLPKLMSIELVMQSNHLILYRSLLLLPSIFPSIRIFSSKSVLLIRWPKYWSFSFSISPSNK